MRAKHLILCLMYVVAVAVYFYVYKVLNLVINEFDSSFSFLSTIAVFVPFCLALGIVIASRMYIRSGWFKKICIGGSLLLILMPFLYSVSKLAMNERHEVNPGVRAELSKLFNEAVSRATDRTIIELSSMTRFDWDQTIMFGPYVSSDEVNKKLGYTWTRSSFLNSNETDYMILFIDNGKVVQYLSFFGSMDPALLGKFHPKDIKLEVEMQGDSPFIRSHLKEFKEEPDKYGDVLKKVYNGFQP